MLKNLHVKNMALIEEIDVDFENGLIVFTGETGAGKSLLLGSVNIALGQKASKELIRQGTNYSLVEMTFQIGSRETEYIKSFEIDMEDDYVTVTRKISEGRSICKINGETVNLSTLKAVMSVLVDIHGQHEHQSLLYEKKHLEILDQFAWNEESALQKQLKQTYAQYKELNNRLAKLDIDEAERAREIEFAQFEVSEIASANLEKGEDEKLEQQLKLVSNSQEILSAISSVYQFLGYDQDSGAGAQIGRAILELDRVSDYDSSVKAMQDSLYEIDELCRDVVSEIETYHRNMEFDPETARSVEERFDIISHLKLKYGKSIEEILQYAKEKQAYLDRLIHLQDELDLLHSEIHSCYEKMEELCAKISEIRKNAAKRLEEQIVTALEELNFLSVDFRIVITRKEEISENGYDHVAFMISTNPGEPLMPLAKIASGGELSRIMLAIKSILASEDDVDTLIFDEIDTGISGRTAQKVAEKLAKISKNHQIICVSHLSQIAAMADHHYLIEKHLENDRTITMLRELERDASIREIVRINGGTEITSASLIQAEEMKDMATQVKSNLS